MTFKKGQSGNPGGRPKEFDEVKTLARKHTTDAIKRLVDWMKSDNPKASVSAACALLDRGHGKPAQTIDATVNGEIGTYAAQPIPVEQRDSDALASPDRPAINGHSPGHS